MRLPLQRKKQWSVADPIAVLYIKSNLRLVVNLQDCVKAQQSRAYAQKVKISNLQQMANTIVYVQQHGYDSYDDLKKRAMNYLPKCQIPATPPNLPMPT